MSLDTFSLFYFVDPVTENNNFINFDEGNGEISTEVDVGAFTLTDLTTRIETALNGAGNNTYTVTFDRNKRKYTISSDGIFDLLVNTGSQSGVSIFPLIGFTNGDRTGSTSYTGESRAGKKFEPQFILQDYNPSGLNESRAAASVNESTTGKVEVVSFGTVSFVDMNIRYINNKKMDGLVIKNDPQGVENAVTFMKHVTNKRPVEFMEDINNPAFFESLLLENTPQSRQGTQFQLQERIQDNLPKFYDTGQLRFRVI